MTIKHTFLTDEELQEIEARTAAAVPAPWRVSSSGYSVKSDNEDVPIIAEAPNAMCVQQQFQPWMNNAEFIAHARADVPRLLLEIEKLQYEIHILRSGRDEAENDGSIWKERAEAAEALLLLPFAPREQT